MCCASVYDTQERERMKEKKMRTKCTEEKDEEQVEEIVWKRKRKQIQ